MRMDRGKGEQESGGRWEVVGLGDGRGCTDGGGSVGEIGREVSLEAWVVDDCCHRVYFFSRTGLITRRALTLNGVGLTPCTHSS